MTIQISVEINKADVAKVEALALGISAGSAPTLSRAINRTLTGARTEFVEAMYSVYNLTKTFIRTKIFVHYTTPGYLSGAVRTSDRLLWLKDFKPRFTKNYVSYRIYRNETLQKRYHWFTFKDTGHAYKREMGSKYATGISKYRGQPKNLLPWKSWDDKYRLPIVKQTGARIQDAFARPDVAARVNANIQKRADTNINQQIDLLLSKF